MLTKILILKLRIVLEVLSFLVRMNLKSYQETIINVLNAGIDTGMTCLSTIKAFKDLKLTPEEELDLAEKLTNNKRSLDKALTSLIKDLKDHALEKTKGEKNA